MKEKEYVCAYSHCLHHGDKVPASQSVVIGKRHYHWDCASIKQEIQECAELYIDSIEDKTQYPIVMRILNTMVFKNKVPIEYIRKQISTYMSYYASKPVYVLYGIRKIFYEKEFKA